MFLTRVPCRFRFNEWQLGTQLDEGNFTLPPIDMEPAKGVLKDNFSVKGTPLSGSMLTRLEKRDLSKWKTKGTPKSQKSKKGS